MDYLKDKDYELTITKARNGFITKFWDDIVADEPTIRLEQTIFEDKSNSRESELQNLKELLYFVAGYFGEDNVDIEIKETK